MSKKDVTIYDIATELKVSPSTVSRALKNHFSIGKELTETIKKYAQKRGYRPNHIAASLRRNKTNTIGVLIPWINRPFISSLIGGIEEIARQHGYNVLISQSHDSYESEVTNCQALYNSRIGGLVVSLAMETKKYDHFNEFTKNNIPIVFVDRIAEEFQTDRVIIDNFVSGFMATEHLIQQGCKRIAHFAGAQHRNVYRERQRGYMEALKRYNIPAEEQLVIEGNILNAEEGHAMADRILDLPNPPDGLFSANDTAAVSAIQVAKKRQIKIPKEFAVIGFNNDPISSIIDPPLSTISHPAISLGRIAAEQVLKYSEYRDIVSSETITLKTELIVRESSLRK